MDLNRAIATYQQFCGMNLTSTVASAEAALRGSTSVELPRLLTEIHATEMAVAGAGELKRLAGQVNVAIHALGILLCLPHILEEGETIEYASLGAGNTGREFDLETDRRVAEFKFITWRGGSESIRQNGVFKDFFLLAEHPTRKRKYLYVLGTTYPLKFLRGGRALRSVLKDARLAAAFYEKYDNTYQKVREYYRPREGAVTIQDVSRFVPSLTSVPMSEVDT